MQGGGSRVGGWLGWVCVTGEKGGGCPTHGLVQQSNLSAACVSLEVQGVGAAGKGWWQAVIAGRQT